MECNIRWTCGFGVSTQSNYHNKATSWSHLHNLCIVLRSEKCAYLAVHGNYLNSTFFSHRRLWLHLVCCSTQRCEILKLLWLHMMLWLHLVCCKNDWGVQDDVTIAPNRHSSLISQLSIKGEIQDMHFRCRCSLEFPDSQINSLSAMGIYMCSYPLIKRGVHIYMCV